MNILIIDHNEGRHNSYRLALKKHNANIDIVCNNNNDLELLSENYDVICLHRNNEKELVQFNNITNFDCTRVLFSTFRLNFEKYDSKKNLYKVSHDIFCDFLEKIDDKIK